MRQSNHKKSRDMTAFPYERISRDDNLEGERYSIGDHDVMAHRQADAHIAAAAAGLLRAGAHPIKNIFQAVAIQPHAVILHPCLLYTSLGDPAFVVNKALGAALQQGGAVLADHEGL